MNHRAESDPVLPDDPMPLDSGEPATALPMPVEVVRSARRKRTVEGSIVDGTARILIPAGLPRHEEQRLVDEMVAKLRRKMAAGTIDLATRASRLARRYDLSEPSEIEWSNRQGRRWGSCTPHEGRIRISNRLAGMPAWVLDYVLVHELAHLDIGGHGADFKALVNRYELAERARGYLIAASHLGTT